MRTDRATPEQGMDDGGTNRIGSIGGESPKPSLSYDRPRASRLRHELSSRGMKLGGSKPIQNEPFAIGGCDQISVKSESQKERDACTTTYCRGI